MTILFLALACVPLQATEDRRPVPALEEVFRFTDKDVVGFDFDPAGGAIGLGGTGHVSTFDLKSFKIVKQAAQRDLVDELLFDPAGKLLVSRSKGPDTVVRGSGDLAPLKFVMDVPSSAYKKMMEEGSVPRSSSPAAFSADGMRLALVSGSRGVRVWGLDRLGEKQSVVYEIGIESVPLPPQKNAEQIEFHALLDHGTAIAFEGRRLWVGMEEGYVLPVDPRLLRPLDDPVRKPDRAPVDPPQPPDPGKLPRRDFKSLKQIREFKPHDGDITSILFLPGDRLLTAGMDGKIRVWAKQEVVDREPSVRSADKIWEPQPVKTLDGHFASLSQDRRFVAVAETGGVRCYDSQKWTVVSWTETDPKLGTLARVKFNPDGELLAATICACPTCLKRDVIYTTGRPRMRSHHHGGVLIGWKTRTDR